MVCARENDAHGQPHLRHLHRFQGIFEGVSVRTLPYGIVKCVISSDQFSGRVRYDREKYLRLRSNLGKAVQAFFSVLSCVFCSCRPVYLRMAHIVYAHPSPVHSHSPGLPPLFCSSSYRSTRIAQTALRWVHKHPASHRVSKERVLFVGTKLISL